MIVEMHCYQTTPCSKLISGWTRIHATGLSCNTFGSLASAQQKLMFVKHVCRGATVSCPSAGDEAGHLTQQSFSAPGVDEKGLSKEFEYYSSIIKTIHHRDEINWHGDDSLAVQDMLHFIQCVMGKESTMHSISSWERLVKFAWIGVYAGDMSEDMKGSFFDFIKRCALELSHDACISMRLGLGLLSAGSRLDQEGRVGFVQDLLSIVDMQFVPTEHARIVSFMDILRDAGIHSSAFTQAMSDSMDSGLLGNLDPLELGVLLDSISKIHWHPSLKHKRLIWGKALAQSRHLSSDNIVSLVQLLTRSPSAHARDIQEVAELVSDKIHLLSIQDLGQIARTFGTIHAKDTCNEVSSQVLGKIASQAMSCIEGADPRDLVRLIQAFQNAQIKPDALLDVLDVWADKRLGAMNAQGISLAMTHFARVGEASPRLLKTAVNVAESNLDNLTPSDASKLIWAFAHLEYDPGAKLLDRGIDILESSLTSNNINDREIANLLWGLVKLERYPSMNERINIASMLYQETGRVSGQSAALLLWSFASSYDMAGGTLTDKRFNSTIYRLGTDLCRDISHVDSQSISITAWSLGILKVPHRDFVECLDSLGLAKLRSFEPQHISNLLWGLAKTGSHPSDLFISDTVEALSGRLNIYSPQELFNVCWSFATMRILVPKVVTEATIELQNRVTEFHGLELTGMTWALSKILIECSKRDSSLKETPIMAKNIASIVQRELQKHIEVLEVSQLAMAIVGLARLHEVNSKLVINDQLITASVEKFTNVVKDAKVTVNSVNTILEGLLMLERPLPDHLMGALQNHITADVLRNALFWEVCDLCYHLNQSKMHSLAKTILQYIDEQVSNGERVTPRASIMLLQTMVQCNCFPSEILQRTTAKLSSLSPNYRISDKWIRVLAKTRPLLPMDAQILLTFHPTWEERLIL